MIIDGKSVALIAAGLTAVMGGIGSAWGVGLAGKSTSAVLSENSGSARYAGFLCLYSHVFGARQN